MLAGVISHASLCGGLVERSRFDGCLLEYTVPTVWWRRDDGQGPFTGFRLDTLIPVMLMLQHTKRFHTMIRHFVVKAFPVRHREPARRITLNTSNEMELAQGFYWWIFFQPACAQWCNKLRWCLEEIVTSQRKMWKPDESCFVKSGTKANKVKMFSFLADINEPEPALKASLNCKLNMDPNEAKWGLTDELDEKWWLAQNPHLGLAHTLDDWIISH